MRSEADAAYQKKDWKAALPLYEKIASAEPNDFGPKYRLGVCLIGLSRYRDAIGPLEIVMTASPNPVFATALARAFAGAKEAGKMFEVLEQATKLGGIPATTLDGSAEFAAFRSDDKFVELSNRLDIAANPCNGSPEFRQFDFWIGEWDAKNAQGLTVGSSSIELILSNCVIFENWNTPVNSGKSFNVFNRNDKKWYQTWVDDKGNINHYTGTLIDGKMVMIGESPNVTPRTLLRMTFSKLPDGGVRQLGESSTDDGKTWTQRYDFTYVRKPGKK
ncbi:MAG: tetratricopeptide repeat protein [Acidobacteria bacterium]|nr:tetratricopeptide repeat protein [Acidobacteriota bacterium]